MTNAAFPKSRGCKIVCYETACCEISGNHWSYESASCEIALWCEMASYEILFYEIASCEILGNRVVLRKRVVRNRVLRNIVFRKACIAKSSVTKARALLATDSTCVVVYWGREVG